MPRAPNFPYNYSYPAGTPGTPNATISSAAYNGFLTDLQTTLNTAQPINYGGTGGTSQITGWDGLSAQGIDVASATSINLDGATGPFVNITGTTTVTGIVLAAGKLRWARATGAFQLTASSALVVNGSASTNYTTTAGDLLQIEGQSGVVYVWHLSAGISDLSTFVLTNSTRTMTVGLTATPNNIGTVTTGTTTPSGALGQLQYMTNNGASTIAAPAADTELDILITNGASAGSLSFSGFTVGSNTGSAFDTTNGHKFKLSISRINGISTYSNYALQ